jgi:uncharacterized protein YfdQ (DUF2303 family)
MADQKSEAEFVAELAARAVKPDQFNVQRGHDGEATVLLVPNGMTVKSAKPFVDEYLPNPERRKGTAHFTELSSFIAHAIRFKAEESAIFAESSQTSPKLTSVIDYHVAGPDEDRVKARHGQHRGVYHFPLDDAWKAWREADTKSFTQRDFAAFLEDRILDVIDPATAAGSVQLFATNTGTTFASPAKMMALSRGLSVTVNAQTKEAINLATGEAQIAFASEHRDEAGQKLTVPGAFVVQLPVFKSGAAYQIPIRLRYRVKEQAVIWSFSMYRPDRYFDDALLDACDRAKTETDLPLFMGAPES